MKRSSEDKILRAASLFFAVRGLVRTKLAQGKRLDPSKWLRVETMKFIECSSRPTMRELAAYLSITAPSATSLVRGLEREGLLVRTLDLRDRRATRLALTPKGKRVLAKTLTRGAEILRELFGVLSERELAALTRALERIRERAGGAGGC